MGNREIPFDPDAICGDCGGRGAFDFMGDLICQECLDSCEEDEQDVVEEPFHPEQVAEWQKAVKSKRKKLFIRKKANIQGKLTGTSLRTLCADELRQYIQDTIKELGSFDR